MKQPILPKLLIHIEENLFTILQNVNDLRKKM